MTALENIENNHKAQTFIKVVAWIFIILSGIGLVSTFLQNIVMWTMPVYDELTSSAMDAEGIPIMTKFIMSNLRLYLFASLVFLIAVFVSSVGLLKMKEWARRLFSILLAISALVGVIATTGYVAAFVRGNGIFALPSDVEFKPLIAVALSISMVIAIALIGVSVWIIVKLNSVKIKNLFEPTVSNGQR